MMKRALTITGVLLLLLAVLLLGSAFIASRSIDPNKFKGRISQLVYARTGQVLIINGNMYWSIFPWIGLKATDLTYYNPPSFTPKVFVHAKEMNIKVKVVPLLRGRIEVNTITLNNALLNIIKNKSGKFNWEMFAKSDKKFSVGQNTSYSGTITNLVIASLKIKNGKLTWHDQQKNTQAIIESLNIEAKHMQFFQPFPLSLQFNLLNDKKEKVLIFNLESDIKLSPFYKNYALHNLKIKSQLIGSHHRLDCKANGYLTADLKKDRCVANVHFSLNDNDIVGQLNLTGDKLAQAPHFFGTLSTDTVNVKNLMLAFGQHINTKSSEALKSASLLGRVDITRSCYSLTQLHATLDKTDIFGNGSVVPQNKKIRFNLCATRLNADNYFSTKSNRVTKKTAHADSHTWDLEGMLRIANLHIDKLDLSNLTATIERKNNVIKISPMHVSLYKGELTGVILIDSRQQNKIAIQVKSAANNINLKDLLHAFSGTDKLDGTANIDADLTSSINEKTTFVSALNGKINCSINNGSLRGMDIIYQLSRAHAFLKHLPSPTISNSKQTQFNSLIADARVNNGVIRTPNLTITSDYLKVNAKGSVNLVTQEIYYCLNTLAKPKLANENSQIGKEMTIYEVPIKLTGKLSKPSINIDFIELGKGFYAQQIEKAIAIPLQKKMNHLKDKIEEQEDKLIDKYSPAKLLNKLFSKSTLGAQL